MSHQLIINRLVSLQDLGGVSVDITGHTQGTVRVSHNRHHAPDFLFRWSTDHFVGYFIDGNGVQSQAVVSLYSPADAMQFVSAYVMLNNIRAAQR